MTKNGLTWPFTLLGRKLEHAASRGATTNAAGETVTFHYHFNLLTDRHYPRLPQNDVLYDNDSRGHRVEIQDSSGRRQLFYDRMGRVSKNIRTFAVPYAQNTYTFTMEYEYDSWNRMLSMTYPDGERVSYGYDCGGQLESMTGRKGNTDYAYIDEIFYDRFGNRTYVEYGNGTYATYGYDALHGLTSLFSMSSSGAMQQLRYVLDGVGNITIFDPNSMDSQSHNKMNKDNPQSEKGSKPYGKTGLTFHEAAKKVAEKAIDETM